MSDQYSVKISDLLNQKEVNKYITNKEKLISLLKSNCEFLKFSEDNETITYILPENSVVFSILNIPPKMNKDEVKKNIELINLQYNRLYKRGFYWILSTVDKETIICVQNSLRELNFDDIKVKYSIKNKNQLLQIMKEQIDKILYQKESKNLGVNSNSKRKTSDDNSDAFSWRKGSGDNSSNDFSEKRKQKNYYKKNNFKRTRFNSDNATTGYKIQNNNSNNNNNNQDIEIDISNLKYPIIIKNKYSFNDIKEYYKKLVENKILDNKPNFDENNIKIFEELIREKPKELVSIDELIDSCKPLTKNENNKNSDVKIPKINPLCNISKNFNKFDNTIKEADKEQ